MNMGIVGVALILLALLGAPLFVVIGLLALIAFYVAGVDTQSVIIELYRLAANPFMITIPLFTFVGYLMAEAGTAKRLTRFARAAMGWLPGGLVLTVVIICSFFTTFSGASGVTIIALGTLLLPALLTEQYPAKFSLGLCTAAGSMGLLFPPSLPLLVYGMMANVEINQLFLAGLLPGVVTVLALAGYGLYVARKAGVKRAPVNPREFFSSLNEVKWELAVPVIILGGILGGFVTVGEAAAITAAYVLIIEVFVYKDLHLFRDVPRVMQKSMMLVGAILTILGCALGLTNYLVDAEVPMKIFAVAQQVFTSKWSFLLALNIFLILIGGFLDIFSAIIVVVPLITPVAAEVGIDPIHLAMIFIASLQVGYLMPPAGMDLCVASLAFNKPMTTMYRLAIPFLIILFVALLVITYVPELSLFLVR
ncbi:MAG: TRAP transporter large permease subunit [Myxococcota bacterium]|jgi:tripartite ATP-independent transporter DctM subunit|nr:TRAP transporter large permease subunit [Myxococcota bacterium]